MWQNKPQHHDPCLMTLAGYSEPMLACAFSSDGSKMVCASKDRTLKVAMILRFIMYPFFSKLNRFVIRYAMQSLERKLLL